MEAPQNPYLVHPYLSPTQVADCFERSNRALGELFDREVAQLLKGRRVVKRSKLMDFDQAIGIHVQEEIIVEILIRLPVRSILRFKCVSKSWKALISNPYFKRKHLNHAKNNQNSQKLLVSRSIICNFTSGSFHCYSLSSFPRVEDVHRLDCPSNPKPNGQKPYCCYDGLSLVGVDDLPGHCKIVLWNPSTRESVILPPPELPKMGHATWGLGYDSTTDDYKILKIGPQVCSEILALKSGSWRKIDTHPTGIHPMLPGMDSLTFVHGASHPGMDSLAFVYGASHPGMDSLPFVHGAFHWLGKSPSYSLVSFNISSEAYGEIPLPEEMRLICYEEYIRSGVSVLGEALCCYSTNIHGKEGTFKLWLMKDYGVEKSWNICAVIVVPHLYSAIPKYKAPDGELLFYAYTPRRGIHFGFRTPEGPFGLSHGKKEL